MNKPRTPGREDYPELAGFWISTEDLRNSVAHGLTPKKGGIEKRAVTTAMGKVIGHRTSMTPGEPFSTIEERLVRHSAGCDCCIDEVRRTPDNKREVNMADLAYALDPLTERKVIGPGGKDCLKEACAKFLTVALPAAVELHLTNSELDETA